MSILAQHNIGKVCGTCGERKPIDAFPETTYPSGTRGRKSQCRVCVNSYLRLYKAERRDDACDSLTAQIAFDKIMAPTKQVEEI